MRNDGITGVDAAFESLLEEIEQVVGEINQAGSQAFSQGNYDKAQDVLGQAGRVTAFREKVAGLRGDWGTLYAVQSDEVKNAVSKRNLGKLKKGTRTSEDAYVIPILRALAEAGGRSEIGAVLDRVHKLMRAVLKPVDEDLLQSEPNTPRWRNAAQWARNTMVNDGLLRSDSPRGVWEITDKGRKLLQASPR
ncbi:MAG: winged helix-turn-helix domain-containing protein [Armatimonadota bacterium]|nr:winged helix-turn-helix domain-containing protein [Armatimonadota bacterium]